jgi:hypothetical protein
MAVSTKEGMRWMRNAPICCQMLNPGANASAAKMLINSMARMQMILGAQCKTRTEVFILAEFNCGDKIGLFADLVHDDCQILHIGRLKFPCANALLQGAERFMMMRVGKCQPYRGVRPMAVIDSLTVTGVADLDGHSIESGTSGGA